MKRVFGDMKVFQFLNHHPRFDINNFVYQSEVCVLIVVLPEIPVGCFKNSIIETSLKMFTLSLFFMRASEI